MKSFFLLALFLLATFLLNAQDTIVKRNGDTIVAKLSEITPNDLRYKRFDYQDGPLFTIPKEEIKYVIYGNGKRELFENYTAPAKNFGNFIDTDLSLQMSGKYFYYKEKRITEPDMLAVVTKLNDKKLNRMAKQVGEIRFAQDATMLLSISLLVSGAFTYEINRPVRGGRRGPPTNTTGRLQAQQNAKLMMLGGLISGLFSVSFMIDRKRHDLFVVNAYNTFIGRH